MKKSLLKVLVVMLAFASVVSVVQAISKAKTVTWDVDYGTASEIINVEASAGSLVNGRVTYTNKTGAGGVYNGMVYTFQSFSNSYIVTENESNVYYDFTCTAIWLDSNRVQARYSKYPFIMFSVTATK